MDVEHYWILEDADEYGYHYKCPICKHTYIAKVKHSLPYYCIFCNTLIRVNESQNCEVNKNAK